MGVKRHPFCLLFLLWKEYIWSAGETGDMKCVPRFPSWSSRLLFFLPPFLPQYSKLLKARGVHRLVYLYMSLYQTNLNMVLYTWLSIRYIGRLLSRANDCGVYYSHVYTTHTAVIYILHIMRQSCMYNLPNKYPWLWGSQTIICLVKLNFYHLLNSQSLL